MSPLSPVISQVTLSFNRMSLQKSFLKISLSLMHTHTHTIYILLVTVNGWIMKFF